MTLLKVEVYQDAEGVGHFELRQFKVPRTRLTFCGKNTKEMKHSAWFDVGDRRGLVHYARACDTCSAALTV